jgi:hypothetical protein
MEISMTRLEMLLSLLSPREASAEVVGDPYAINTLKDIKKDPSQEYLPRQYRRIVNQAQEVPERVTVLPAQEMMQRMGAAAAYDPADQHVFYNPEVLTPAENAKNSLVHELVHHLAIYGRDPRPSNEEQHRLLETFLGASTYAPADELKGYVPSKGNLKDLEEFERLLVPAKKYYKTR